MKHPTRYFLITVTFLVAGLMFPSSVHAGALCPASMQNSTSVSGSVTTLLSSYYGTNLSGQPEGAPITSAQCLSACQSHSAAQGYAASCGLEVVYTPYSVCYPLPYDPYYICGEIPYYTSDCKAGLGPLVGGAHQGAQCSFTYDPPTASLSANHSSILQGGSYNVTMSWSSTYATSCTGTNFNTGGATSGSVAVPTPSTTTTYSVNCTGPGGSASQSRTITVVPPATASLNVSATSVYLGQPVTITWSGVNADSCTGSGFSTNGSTGGSITMTMNTLGNNVFGVTCSGPLQSASASKTVVVSSTPGSSCDAGIGTYPTTSTVFSGDFWNNIENATAPYYSAINQETIANGGGPIRPVNANWAGFYANKATADRICSVLWPGSYSGGYGSDDYDNEPGNNDVLVWTGTKWERHNAGAGWNSHIRNNFTCLQYNPAPAAMKLPSNPVVAGSASGTEWFNPLMGGGYSGTSIYCPNACTQYAAANGIDGTYYCGQSTQRNTASYPVCFPGSNGEVFCADGYYAEGTTTCYVGGSPVVGPWSPSAPSETYSWAVACTYDQPNVVANVSVSPTSINAGSSATITWSSSNATSCTGTNFSTGGATSGSVSVSPVSTTTYSITCSGPGGSQTQSVSLTVNTPSPQCGDGIDNDGDGAVDLADTGCTGPTDTTESPNPPPQCSNGIDDDADGKIDSADFGCTGPTDTTESPNPECSNGIDDDGDGKVDLVDTGCTGSGDDNESGETSLPDLTFFIGNVTPIGAYPGTPVTLKATIWNDGSASTGTGFTNLFQHANDDIGTGAIVIGTHQRTTAVNAGENFEASLSYTFPFSGVWWMRACADNDALWNDDITESDEDNNCGAWTKMTVLPPGASECNDSTDNDGDGRVDGADYGCDDASDPTESPNPQCSDGIDNDGDGRTDTLDYACVGNPTGPSESPNPQCSDSIDNDGDGRTDSLDYGCVGGPTDTTESPNPECSDMVDNDGDGKIDIVDLGCFGLDDTNEQTSAAVTSLAVTSIAGTTLVQRGNPAILAWSAEEAVSCKITSSRGYDSGPLTGPFDGSSRTHTTSAVNAQTDFTITCANEEGTPVSSTVTVSLIPDTGEI